MKYFPKTKRDKNHLELVAYIKSKGCSVIDLAAVGGSVPDILVGGVSSSGIRFNVLMEIKSTRGKLMDNQHEFINTWLGQTTVVRNKVDVDGVLDFYQKL